MKSDKAVETEVPQEISDICGRYSAANPGLILRPLLWSDTLVCYINTDKEGTDFLWIISRHNYNESGSILSFLEQAKEAESKEEDDKYIDFIDKIEEIIAHEIERHTVITANVREYGNATFWVLNEDKRRIQFGLSIEYYKPIGTITIDSDKIITDVSLI